MADLQAGRTDGAIEGFERVTLAEPGNYSAHFQLATLLQDIKKDYVGAIAHYRAYLKLRPASEKSAIAEERMRLCERQYTAFLTEKSNLAVVFRDEKVALEKSRDAAVAKASKLEAELADARREVERLRKENASQHSLLAKIGGDDDGASAPQTIRSRIRPSDADLLDDPDETGPSSRSAKSKARPSDADDSDNNGGSGTDRFANSQEAKRLRALLDAEDRADAASSSAAKASTSTNRPPSSIEEMFGAKKKKAGPARPQTYVVEEGDTLMRISARFYGTNSKWRQIRDANRDIISTDGRVRAGQEIVLP